MKQKKENLIAKAETTVNAPSDKVWDALVNPSKIKTYMMGATVVSDWKKGSSITWKGEFKGKPYEDKGKILEIAPTEKLQYSHFSPLSGMEDIPENYHTVTISLSSDQNKTTVTLLQDKNSTEEAKIESEKNWKMMLDGIKKLAEEKSE